MRLVIMRRDMLSTKQTRDLESRLANPENQHDKGPPTVWDIYSHSSKQFFAFVLKDTRQAIGIVHVSISPNADAGWWIDSQFRGKGYGNELVDLLANRLKEIGYTSAEGITIDTFAGQYHNRSQRLRERFQAHFCPANS
jgi:RimJ/RimL family protein N-acetyltransferase